MLIWNRIGLICPDYAQHKCLGNTPPRRPAFSSRKDLSNVQKPLWRSMMLIGSWPGSLFHGVWNTPYRNWVGFPSPIFTQITRVNWSLQLRIAPQQHRQSVAKLLHQLPGGNSLEFCCSCVKHNVYRVTLLSHFGTWRCKLGKIPPNPWWNQRKQWSCLYTFMKLIGQKTQLNQGNQGWISRYKLQHLAFFHIKLVGGFNPFEKYESNWGSSPIFGMKIKNLWNHHPVNM